MCDEEDSGLSDEEQKRKRPKNSPRHTRKRIHQAKKNFLEKFKTVSKKQSKMKTNTNYDMYIPTRLIFGEGMLNKLNEQPMPGKKALIIISNGKSTRANGYLQRTEEQLHKAGVETVVFDGVSPNPTVENVNAGAEKARTSGSDFLVALGGGSLINKQKNSLQNRLHQS